MGGADPSHDVTSLRARDAKIEAKSRSAVLDLYALDSRLERSRGQVSTLQGQARSLRAQRLALEAQLTVARHSTKIGERQLEERVRRLYEQGSVEPLEVVLGAKSIAQAISNLDNLRSISSESEAVLDQLTSARRSLTTASKALAKREAALATAMREAQAAEAALVSTRTQRASYIASLAAQHRLTQGQIATLVARAQAAQLRSAQLMRASIAVSAPESATDEVAPSGRSLTVSATAYSLPGHTASGLPVGWGVVAVDPSVIPLGTHLFVPGYGEAVAADTGTAIIGDRIDLWFPSLAQAQAWGRQTVTIVLH